MGGRDLHIPSLNTLLTKKQSIFSWERRTQLLSHPWISSLRCGFLPTPHHQGRSRCSLSGNTCPPRRGWSHAEFWAMQRECTMPCFVCFSSWTCRSVGEKKKAKVRSAMPWTLWLAPLPPFPAQSSHHTLIGVLEHLHIPVVQEVCTHAASRRHRGTVGGGPASIGVSRSWPASAGEPHSLGKESGLW